MQSRMFVFAQIFHNPQDAQATPPTAVYVMMFCCLWYTNTAIMAERNNYYKFGRGGWKIYFSCQKKRKKKRNRRHLWLVLLLHQTDLSRSESNISVRTSSRHQTIAPQNLLSYWKNSVLTIYATELLHESREFVSA